MDIESQRRLQAELTSGERLLWSGRPRGGIRLRPADALMIPFSLVWAGFIVFWEATVFQGGGPIFAVLWGIPFLLIGLHLAFGRFVVDSYRRSHTFYGLTDQRAIIRTPRGVKSLSLRGMADLSLKEGSDRSGSITFGSTDPRLAFFAGSGWPGMGRLQPPSFEMIENARQVYTQIRDAQRAAERGGG